MKKFSKQLIPVLFGMIWLSISSLLLGQKYELKLTANELKVAFYNIENLFDTINDPDINDLSYLPTSQVAWNTERYLTKLDNISRVIAAMDTLDFPHLLGLSEVENKKVLQDLIKNKQLVGAGYEIVHYDGPDRRGIEVALLYRSQYFTPVFSQSIEVDREGIGRTNPRDILYVKGILTNQDTIHLFVNHWSSRWGGASETAYLRNHTARFLRKAIDSLFTVNSRNNIIVMGDFNDNPDDESLSLYLNAKSIEDEIQPAALYNPAMNLYLEGEGTSYYNNNWDFFDQIIISGNLINPVNGGWIASRIEVVKKPWMLYHPPKGGEPRPNRTSSTRSYFGGYSDHLPVMMRFSSQKKNREEDSIFNSL